VVLWTTDMGHSQEIQPSDNTTISEQSPPIDRKSALVRAERAYTPRPQNPGSRRCD
jgi:hypothetical protein